MTDEMTHTRVLLSTLEQYREWAKEEGRHISYLINEALISYLKNRKKAKS